MPHHLTELTVGTYDKIAGQYANDFLNNDHDEKIARGFSTGLARGARILDAGCGCGGASKVFLDNGFDVVGIDLSTEMLKIAKTHASKAHFEIGDVRATRFSAGEFDAIYASRIFCHLQNRDRTKTLREFRRVLKPNGKLMIVNTVSRKSYGEIEREPYDENLKIFYNYFTLDDLKKSITGAGFSIKDVRTEDHIDEDTNQPVTLAVVLSTNLSFRQPVHSIKF